MTQVTRQLKLIALCACFTVHTGLCAEYSGKVVGISDGDTVTVLDAHNQQHKIRLSGIDAPEKKQPFGNASKENLSRLVFARTVMVETNKVDRYGREVGRILVDGKDANLEQIRSGLAWHYKAYEREQPPAERSEYAAVEAEARRRRGGGEAGSAGAVARRSTDAPLGVSPRTSSQAITYKGKAGRKASQGSHIWPFLLIQSSPHMRKVCVGICESDSK